MSKSNKFNGDKDMSHTARIREVRWDAIEKQAWKLSQKAGKLVKPTDVLDAILYKHTDQITIDDVKAAKEER